MGVSTLQPIPLFQSNIDPSVIVLQPIHGNSYQFVAPNDIGISATTKESFQHMSTGYNNNSSHDTLQKLSKDPFLNDASFYSGGQNTKYSFNSKYDLGYAQNYESTSPSNTSVGLNQPLSSTKDIILQTDTKAYDFDFVSQTEYEGFSQLDAYQLNGSGFLEVANFSESNLHLGSSHDDPFNNVYLNSSLPFNPSYELLDYKMSSPLNSRLDLNQSSSSVENLFKSKTISKQSSSIQKIRGRKKQTLEQRWLKIKESDRKASKKYREKKKREKMDQEQRLADVTRALEEIEIKLSIMKNDLRKRLCEKLDINEYITDEKMLVILKFLEEIYLDSLK